MSLDTMEFRRAVGQFATGVTIVTTLGRDGEPVGMTASSFNSVSLDPPLVLWSVQKNAWGAPAFLDCSRYAIHVLAAGQVALSNRFAQRGTDKFAGVDWSPGDAGMPMLGQCLARFDCETWAQYDGGDHVILVGKVLGFSCDDTQRPLIFSKGSYAVPLPGMIDLGEGRDDAMELPNTLLYLLRAALATSSERLYPEMSSRFGVTPEEWRVLAHLILPERGTIADLAAGLELPEEPLVTQVSGLVQKGLLEWGHQCSEAILTGPGRDLASALFAFILRDDELCAAAVEQAGATNFKDGLRILSGHRAGRA